MRSYRVSRGVGKSPVILKLSERYLGYFALGILAGFVAFFLCRVLIDSNAIGIVVFGAVVLSSFFYCQNMSVKHGEHGMSKMSAYKSRPRILVTRSRSVFLNLKSSK